MKLFLVIFYLLFVSFLIGQETQEDFQEIMSRYGYNVSRPSTVSFNYFYDFTGRGDTSLFYFSFSIQNDFLQFLKTDKFASKYQVSLILKQEKLTILSKTWKEELELDEFIKTNSFRDFQYSSYMIDLKEFGLDHFKPGEYEVFIDIQDLQSSRKYKNKRKMTIPEIKDKENFLSEITFLRNRGDTIPEKLNITSTRTYLDFNTPYTAYTRAPKGVTLNTPVNIRLYKKNEDDKILLDQTYSEVSSSYSQHGTVEYLLPYEKLEEGDYLLRFSIDADSTNYQAEKEFTILWFWKPLYLFKTDLAVRPMKYLLDEDEMKQVKGYNLEELKKWFNKYWKKNDPTPETVYNEKQDFYYKRVSEAVRLYSDKDQEGWQTDFGKIFILYGEPTETENRKYSVNSVPHVIWKYIIDGETYSFKFVDAAKNGKFKLVE